jgi:hypothetical protein
MRVGHTEHRLVAQEFASSWMVPLVDQHTPKFVCRIWKSMKGEFNVALFNQCLHAVASLIMERPGISEDLITERLIVMERAEVVEVLEYLIASGAVTFESDNGKGNCYFAQPAFYLKLQAPATHDPVKSKSTLFRTIPSH